MKKDKKWLLDELMKFKESTPGRYEDVIGVSHVLRVIDQLDEPEKVVISQNEKKGGGMKRDKEWLMKEMKTLLSKSGLSVPYVVSFYNLIAQLEEPLYLIRFSDNQYALKDYEGGIRSILVDKKYANQFTRVEIDKLGSEYWAFAVEVKE